MNKKQIALLILITGIIVWVADLFIGNYLSARLATSPLARKFNLINPQAPIVVTNRETVRVDNATDIVATAENAKSKVATLVYLDAGKMVVTGGLVNWTSDGYFITSESAFSALGKVYAVVLNNGDIFPIIKTYKDPSSALVIVETSAQGVAVMDPADSKDWRAGQQVIAVQNSVGNNQASFGTGYIKRLPQDSFGRLQESDLISRTMELTQVADFIPGQGIVNLSGRLIGVWDGRQVVPVEEVKLLVNAFLQYQKNIVRPSYGFSYQVLSISEAKALQTDAGVKILAVGKNSPAETAGLKSGDVITKIDEQDVNSQLNFDNFLRLTKPGQLVKLEVRSGGQIKQLVITAGQK